jgi:hypothetical protein
MSRLERFPFVSFTDCFIAASNFASIFGKPNGSDFSATKKHRARVFFFSGSTFSELINMFWLAFFALL